MRSHAATIIVLALLVGTAIAFAETERLKLEPTPIEESYVQPAFSPVCGCDEREAAIRVRLHRADRLTIRILDSAGDTVRVLTQDQPFPRGRTQIEWNGRNESGGVARDGTYRVDVRLVGEDRTFRLPQVTRLDTVAPRAHLRRALRRVRVGQRVQIFYRVSEAAHGVLFVNGKREAVTYTKLRSAKLDWHPKKPGRYRLQLAALDLAGNLGPRTHVFTVLVRS